MTEQNLFIMRLDAANSLREMLQLGKKLKEVEQEVDEWIAEHGIGATKFDDVSVVIGKGDTVWTPPRYMFEDEYEALQFKMIFGEHFDHSVNCRE